MLPIVYKWTDGNAPVARGDRKSLNDILHACLVTGYGEKPGAGWTREYVNAAEDQAAYRNNPVTGTGFFLRVSGPLGINAYGFQAIGYESMTSDLDGTFAFYTGSAFVPTSNAVSTTARPWILIADDRAFYFYCWVSSTGTGLPTSIACFGFFFGDLTGVAADDAYACGIAGSTSIDRSAVLGYLSDPSGTTQSDLFSIAVARKKSGVAGYYKGINIRGGGPGHVSVPGAAGLPYTAGGPIFITRAHINEAAAQTYRGLWPGLWYPCHALAFSQFQNVVVDGKSFLSLRVPTDVSAANLFISLDDWRA